LHQHPRPVLLLPPQEQALYFVDSSGLQVLFTNFTQERLLQNLIMFGHQRSADVLCTLNGWDRRALRIHALKLGLQYRQLNVVQPALAGLDMDQQWEATDMMLDFIATTAHADPDLAQKIVRIGMFTHVSKCALPVWHTL
jgi:hypothetical protein